MFYNKKLVLLKTETTYGTDPTPTSLSDFVEARNVSIEAINATAVDRKIEQPFLGNSGNLMANPSSKISFDIALAPSGTVGRAPKWAAMLLACGFAQTSSSSSVVFNLVSSGFASATVYFWLDQQLRKIIGLRGTVSFTAEANGIPLLKFSGTGLYVPVVESAPILPNAAARAEWQQEELVSSSNTSATLQVNNGSATAVSLKTCTADVANQLNLVHYVGYREVVLQDRKPVSNLQMVAPDLGSFNPQDIMLKGDTVAVTLNHGSTAGKKASLALLGRINKCAVIDLDGQVGWDIGLDLVPTSVGNDELTLTLS